MKQHSKSNRPTIENRKAKYEYFIEDVLECGINLRGNEVKSIIKGSANINEAWCSIEDGQLILHNMHISKYDTSNDFDVKERRDRVLLAHKKEIIKLSKAVNQAGYTLVPLKVFWDRQYVKISVGLCKGKHNYDKRESLKQKDMQRSISRYTS